MEWKYYIYQDWENPNERKEFDDIELMPVIDWKGDEKQSFILYVEALGTMLARKDSRELEKFEPALKGLRGRNYVFEEDYYDMLVSANDFNRVELIEYARIFIKEIFHDDNIILTESCREEFHDTSVSIRLSKQFKKRIKNACKKNGLKKIWSKIFFGRIFL